MAEMEKRVASLVSLNQSLSEKNSKLKDAETKLTHLLKSKEREDAARFATATAPPDPISSRRSAAPSNLQAPSSGLAAASTLVAKEEKSDKKRKPTSEPEESVNTSYCNVTTDAEDAVAEAGLRRKKVCFEAEPQASVEASKKSALIENIPPTGAITDNHIIYDQLFINLGIC
jgi:hypothetical protein